MPDGLIVGTGKQLEIVMKETSRFTMYNGQIVERRDPWSQVAINVYDEHYLRGVVAASALTKAPIIAEISASSAKALGDGDIDRGVVQLANTLDNFLQYNKPIKFKGIDGIEYEIPLDDAMVFLYLDHFIFGEHLAKNHGNFEKTYTQAEKIWEELAKIQLLAGGMIDAGAVPLEQNIKVSKMVVGIMRNADKFAEAEYTATGGLGDEASGHDKFEKSTDENRAKLVNEIMEYGRQVNPNALAYAAGTTHVAKIGQKEHLDWLLMKLMQQRGLIDGSFRGYPIHGGSSAADYELGLNRGLYWKVNKATEPKRNSMVAVASFILANLPDVMADMSGNLALVEGDKKRMDEAHHPKNISFPPREAVMLFSMAYSDVVGSTEKVPYLKEAILKN